MPTSSPTTGPTSIIIDLFREGYYCSVNHIQWGAKNGQFSGHSLRSCKAACEATAECKFVSYSIRDPTGGHCYGYPTCVAKDQKPNGSYNIYKKPGAPPTAPSTHARTHARETPDHQGADQGADHQGARCAHPRA